MQGRAPRREGGAFFVACRALASESSSPEEGEISSKTLEGVNEEV